MNKQNPDIKFLFEPRSMAVIGASGEPKKVGYAVIKNMIEAGYKGKIYPINPKGGEILGHKVYKSIEEVPGEVDVATIVVPAKFCFESVRCCAKKQVKFLSIITSGFSEVGNTQEEKDMVAFARENGMRILGPNIFGYFSATAPINATFAGSKVTEGNVAILTQSGALGIAMIGKTQVENIGLSAIISIGNKSDLDESDMIDYLVKSDRTKVIMMYIEGVKNGERFVEKLKMATKVKPVVVIKSGRSKRGAMAAASHTGSLAGADEVFDAIMKQCGVHRASTIQEALNWCKYLADTPMPKGENSVIITNGGGVGVMATDACETFGVNLYDDQVQLKAIFKDYTPEFGSLKNPIDLTGVASMEDYEKAIVGAVKHPDIHSIICLGCETALLSSETLKNTIERVAKEHKSSKPIVYSFVGGKEIEEGVSYLKSKGIPSFTDINESVSCLGENYKDFRFRSRQEEAPTDVRVDVNAINKVIDGALAEGRNFLLAHEGKAVMDAAGVPMPKSCIAQSAQEAVKQAEEMGYPVVMKVVSRDILHKSDAGGVVLNINSKEAVATAYETILKNCRNYDPKANIKGIEVAEMVKKGVETIIGARQDNSFGPVIMFGAGGIYVEVLKDISFRALPLSKNEIHNMMKDTRMYPLLEGVRGEARRDINLVVDVIQKVGAIVRLCERITDIEVNPLVAYEQGKGVKALDVRILIKK